MSAVFAGLEPMPSSRTFVVSYPKCGRTWLRLLLGHVVRSHYQLPVPLCSSDLLFPNLLAERTPQVVPHVTFEHDDDAFFKRPDELTREKGGYGGGKVVFLARDPRDVVVSAYFHKRKRRNFFPSDKRLLPHVGYEGELTDFVLEERGSLRTIVEYYDIWERNRATLPEFFAIRYEDLVRDTQGQLGRLLGFLGLHDVALQVIDDAVAFASFDNMRRMESEDAFGSVLLKPTIPGDADSYKTRRGKIGGYRDYLTAADVESMNAVIQANATTDLFGYLHAAG